MFHGYGIIPTNQEPKYNLLKNWMELLEEGICDGNQLKIKIIKIFFKRLLITPWIKNKIMIIIHSRQGDGKNTLLKPIQ